jgi:glycosyltransferase involved in cell wall biosynthesis
MKILHLGYSDKSGGASIAMMRLHKSLKELDVESNVLVGEKNTNDHNIFGPETSLEKKMNMFKIKLARQKKYFYGHNGKYSHSLNVFSSKIISKINKIKPNIINLHWVNNELISIKEISRLKIPIVWTFNDMWPMCGGEHYVEDDRFQFGYNNTCKRHDETGFDLNKYIWNKKKKFWKSKIDHIVCISSWLKFKAEQSYLFKNHKISSIPCAINLDKWKPVDQISARESLNLPRNKIILLFMSTNGISDLRKGFKYLNSSLNYISKFYNDVVLLNVGNNNKMPVKDKKIINVNKLFNGDPKILSLYYSASDILITPSILEALGQVAIEAGACGVPSIGFNSTGLEDTIKHKKTGYLSKYLDQNDFNNGLKWTIEQIKKNKEYFRTECQNFVKDNFASEIIAKKYIEIYKKILKL